MPTELIVPASDWRAALHPVFAGRVPWASAPLVREPDPAAPRLLARELAPLARVGANFPPLNSWAVVAAPGGDPPDAPTEWLARLRPLWGQTVVVLLVGFGPDRAGWRGWVCCCDRVERLAGFRLVGPGMARVGADAPDAEDDPARWARTVGAVGPRAFAKLRGAEVALIGCSRTGTLAATMFAALGVARLTLFDGDALEPHNLDGAFHAAPGDVGANKALVLGRKLVAFRPDLTVRAVPHPFDAAHPHPARGPIDLVCTCADSDAPRLRAAHWCREHLTVHLDIGTGVTRGAGGERVLAADVRLLLPGRGSGCVCCLGGLGDREQAEYEFHAPPGALPRRPPPAWDAGGRLGSLVTLNGLAVSTGVQSWLDLLSGELAAGVWHRYRWVPGRGLEAAAALVTGTPGCAVCDRHP